MVLRWTPLFLSIKHKALWDPKTVPRSPWPWHPTNHSFESICPQYNALTWQATIKIKRQANMDFVTLTTNATGHYFAIFVIGLKENFRGFSFAWWVCGFFRSRAFLYSGFLSRLSKIEWKVKKLCYRVETRQFDIKQVDKCRVSTVEHFSNDCRKQLRECDCYV